jgi:hypothetical protein
MTCVLQLQSPLLGISQRHTRNADIRDSVADNLSLTLWAVEIDLAQVDVVTDSVRAASKLGDLASVLAARHSGEVLEDDVVDIDSGWVLGADLWLDVEVAGIENDGPVSVVNVEVLEGDVLNVSVTGGWASPCLKAGTVLEKYQLFCTDKMIRGRQTSAFSIITFST